MGGGHGLTSNREINDEIQQSPILYSLHSAQRFKCIVSSASCKDWWHLSFVSEMVQWRNPLLRPGPGHWRASKESRDSWGAPTVLAIKRVEVNENPGSQSQGEVHRHPYLQASAWAFFCLHSLNLAGPSPEPGNSRSWKVLPPTPSDVEFKPHSNPRHARSSSPQQFPPALQYGAQASSVPLGKHAVSSPWYLWIQLHCRIQYKDVSSIGKPLKIICIS